MHNLCDNKNFLFQTDRNETLPSWAINVFPDGAMYNVTLLEYDLLSTTSLQKQFNGGTFLKEIIGNSLQYKIGDLSKERKIILYSGDERNIVGVLKNLNLWSPHIPNEAAALIFELYFNNNTNMYGMKVTFILFSLLLFYLTFTIIFGQIIQEFIILFRVNQNNFHKF